jgi:hypothetical protein
MPRAVTRGAIRLRSMRVPPMMRRKGSRSWGLILEVDFSQLDKIDLSHLEKIDDDNRMVHSRIKLLSDGSINYAGTIPWSAVTRYAILDWEEIDSDWEHFVTHRMPASLQNAPFTHWVMGYPVTVPEMVWPLQRGYKVEDTSPEANRAWTRYEWDGRPDYPVVLGDEEYEDAVSEHAIEATEEACSIEDRQWYVEDKTEMLTKRNGIEVTVIRETPWETEKQKKAA